MKHIKTYIFLLTTLFFFQYSFAQEEALKIKAFDFTNTILLFEKYELIGKQCKSERNIEKHCEKEQKLFDNNIDDLQMELENTLTYLNIQSEVVSKDNLSKEIYNNKSIYRYMFEYRPILSQGGNSCFANPGALLIDFSIWDRLEGKRYKLDLYYTFFICDIQILVNDINLSLK